MAGPLDSAAGCWVASLAPLLVFDALLVRTGHRSLSHHAGNHPVLTAVLVTYLGLHLLGRHLLPESICRLDPLSVAARRLERKLP